MCQYWYLSVHSKIAWISGCSSTKNMVVGMDPQPTINLQGRYPFGAKVWTTWDEFQGRNPIGLDWKNSVSVPPILVNWGVPDFLISSSPDSAKTSPNLSVADSLITQPNVYVIIWGNRIYIYIHIYIHIYIYIYLLIRETSIAILDHWRIIKHCTIQNMIIFLGTGDQWRKISMFRDLIFHDQGVKGKFDHELG